MNKFAPLFTFAILAACVASAQAQTAPAPDTAPAGTLEPQGGRGGGGGRGGRGGAAIPADYWEGAVKDVAPAGFDKKRDNVAAGKLERVDYDADAVSPGLKRWMEVYTPAGYSKDKKYPILILLHGIGGNE